jgi:DNA-directed RNA polymerase specialized sigma54-like protein
LRLKERQKEEKQQQQSQAPTTEMRAIIELLQLINQKLDKVLANSGTKTPK